MRSFEWDSLFVLIGVVVVALSIFGGITLSNHDRNAAERCADSCGPARMDRFEGENCFCK